MMFVQTSARHVTLHNVVSGLSVHGRVFIDCMEVVERVCCALARVLEPNSIGNAPQKNHPGLMDLVCAARAMAEERRIVPGENPHIPSQATFALENSVRFYYIVPSASTYKVCSL